MKILNLGNEKRLKKMIVGETKPNSDQYVIITIDMIHT